MKIVVKVVVLNLIMFMMGTKIRLDENLGFYLGIVAVVIIGKYLVPWTGWWVVENIYNRRSFINNIIS